jgi:hypothetical protein
MLIYYDLDFVKSEFVSDGWIGTSSKSLLLGIYSDRGPTLAGRAVVGVVAGLPGCDKVGFVETILGGIAFNSSDKMMPN